MPKFVLIDHSICDLAGHHYEYAVHVLRAAAAAGYEPVLVTNRKFTHADQAPCPVVALYEFGFWPEPAIPAAVKSAVAWRARINAAALRLRLRLRYSWIGLAWLCRYRWGDYLKRAHIRGFTPMDLVGFGLIVALKLLRTAVILGCLPVILVVLVCWSLCRLLGLIGTVLAEPVRTGPRWMRRYAAALATEPMSYVESLRAIFRVGQSAIEGFVRKLLNRGGSVQMNAFERDTGALLERIALDREDVVFIPTISERDMVGLAGALALRPSAAHASWHLLFRRNIFEGLPEEYAAQDGAQAERRRAFDLFRERAAGTPAYFYTDTEELTEQYNRLGVFRFRTVPIPHTSAPEDRIPHDGPCRITYLGDARREKGFHYMPRLVNDLQAGWLGKGRFVVQCNFNIPGGEPEAAVARGQLESLPARQVLLYKEALTSAEYRKLLLLADINLLLYDSRNYYARSSGILVESLAAGIPAIVPASSWLSRQFLGPYYAHQESLLERMTLVDTPPRLMWYRHGSTTERADHGGYILAARNSKAYSWLTVPEGATHLLIRAEFAAGCAHAHVQVAQLDSTGFDLDSARTVFLEAQGEQRRATAIIGLDPQARRMWLAASGAHAGVDARLRSIEVYFLRDDPRAPVPTGAVGLIYHSGEEIFGLLREMLEHYPHYNETALRFAGEWRRYHNPDRLVNELIASTGGAGATAYTANGGSKKAAVY